MYIEIIKDSDRRIFIRYNGRWSPPFQSYDWASRYIKNLMVKEFGVDPVEKLTRSEIKMIRKLAGMDVSKDKIIDAYKLNDEAFQAIINEQIND